MIEINLIPEKKSGVTLDNVGGLDLTKINLPFLLIGLLSLAASEWFVGDLFLEEQNVIQAQIDKTEAETKKLAGQLRELEKLKQQAAEFEALEKDLKQKLTVVRQIITKRQNPFRVFKYLAENIPKDVWLKKIDLVDTRLIVQGESLSFKSIGQFIENLKNGIFFNPNIRYSQPESIRKAGRSYEVFELEANIVRFE